MRKGVWFFRDKHTNEIITLCKYCSKQYGTDIKEIDKAGDWDMCSNCEAQNVPSGYNEEMNQ